MSKDVARATVKSRVSARMNKLARTMLPDGEYLGYDPSQVPSQAADVDPVVYENAYNTIPDSSLLHLLDSQNDSNYDCCDGEDGACAASSTLPSPASPTPTITATRTPTPTASFPDSPAEEIYSTPCAYPLSYTPSQRDYDCDYEAVMIAVNDLNRLTKFIMFRGGIPPQQPDPTGIPTTREDVLEELSILRMMMTHMYTRFELS